MSFYIGLRGVDNDIQSVHNETRDSMVCFGEPYALDSDLSKR